jgi:two-component system phosphate regulon sensor histidine kinase PhoR
VDVRALVDECRWELEPIAQGFGVRVDVAARGRNSWQLWGDEVRLKQIVVNLLENAIRYGRPGSHVRIRLRQSRTSLLLVVENDVVHDHHHLPAAWMQPFVRGEHAQDVNPRGLGFGLAIVRELVAAHHGHIVACSRSESVAIGVRLPRSKLRTPRRSKVAADD